MIKPQILYPSRANSGEFYYQIPEGVTPKLKDFIVNIPVSTDTPPHPPFHRGWLAVKRVDGWAIEDSDIQIYIDNKLVSIILFNNKDISTAIAYPIDLRMTKVDIEGATHIYKNTANTGWLFAHSTIEDHEIREAAIKEVVYLAFEEAVGDAHIAVVDSSHRNYSDIQRSGPIRAYKNIIEFRRACMGHAVKLERDSYLGEHLHVDTRSINKIASKAISEIRQEWESKKSAAYNTIRLNVHSIGFELDLSHTYETRWDKAKRIADEAAARAAAESEGDNG